jgi:hypothetical protein
MVTEMFGVFVKEAAAAAQKHQRPPLAIAYRTPLVPFLNAIRVRNHVTYRKCSAVIGDFAADLAYLLASFFQGEFCGVGIDLPPREAVEIRITHRRVILAVKFVRRLRRGFPYLQRLQSSS